MARPTGCRLLRPAVFLLFALLLGLAPASALANSAPPRYLGDTGGPLLPGTSDQVHVLSERLSFDLNEELRGAQVTARYELENRGPALDGQEFIFVIQDPGVDLELTATWRGEPVPVEMLDVSAFRPEKRQEMAQAWTTVDFWIDPVTGERYSDQEFYGGAGTAFFRFAVDMAADVRGDLVVSYPQAGGYDRTLHAHTVYHYHYLLLPARGWASFGPLEIRVSAPEGTRYYFASNLDFRPEDGAYVSNYPGMPEENLAFAVMDKAGIVFGMTQPGPYYWMGLAPVLALAAAIGAGIGWVAGFIPHRGWAITVGALAGLVAGFFLDIPLAIAVLQAFPALRDQGYGTGFIGIAQGLAGMVVTVIAASQFARRTWRNRSGGAAL